MITSKLLNYKACREGFVLVPYKDGIGYSIGCGHFLGRTYPGHQTITVPVAIEMLKADVFARVPQVEAVLKVPLAQHKKDALLDLLYQGGSDGLNAVAKIINRRDPDDKESCLTSDREAAREFLNWDTSADGTHLEGLLGRRGRNVAMYTSNEYGSDLERVPLWHEVDEETKRPIKKDMKFYIVQPGDFDVPVQKGKR